MHILAYDQYIEHICCAYLNITMLLLPWRMWPDSKAPLPHDDNRVSCFRQAGPSRM
jgi:hypothetical protein